MTLPDNRSPLASSNHESSSTAYPHPGTAYSKPALPWKVSEFAAMCLSVCFLYDTDAKCIRHSRFSCDIRSLGYEKFYFFKCFEFTGGTMDTIVMKNIFPLRYEICY